MTTESSSSPSRIASKPRCTRSRPPQKPLFRLLGTPEKDKRHFVFEGGHIAPRIEPIIKEILDWLDRYLGPVRTRPS